MSAGPGAAQVCGIQQTRERGGAFRHEVPYTVASLSPEQADLETLLAPWRGHWLIENSPHWRTA